MLCLPTLAGPVSLAALWVTVEGFFCIATAFQNYNINYSYYCNFYIGLSIPNLKLEIFQGLSGIPCLDIRG